MSFPWHYRKKIRSFVKRRQGPTSLETAQAFLNNDLADEECIDGELPPPPK